MRIPRFEIIYNGCDVHCCWQCHDRQFLLKPDWVKQLLYDLMLKHKTTYKVKIYGYTIMSNHMHFVAHMDDMVLFSRFLQTVHASFAKAYNAVKKRSGQVIQDRAKTPVIEDEDSFKRVMSYVDANPVEAKMVKHPKDYQWSSYHYYADGKKDLLIDPWPTYKELGATPVLRQEAYKIMVETYIEEKLGDKKTLIDIPDLEKEACFLGNPEWVLKKYKELKAKLKKRKENNPRDGTWPDPWNKNLPPIKK
jgi:putative transposase